MIDEVAENLLVGDAGSVLDECRLQLFAELHVCIFHNLAVQCPVQCSLSFCDAFKSNCLGGSFQITHVLTVSAECIPEEKRVKGVCYMFVYALDLETQDMFASNALGIKILIEALPVLCKLLEEI